MNGLIKFLFLFLFSTIYTLAQKAPAKYGDVPLENLKMTVYDKDSSASAVVLLDYGSTKMVYSESNGFQLSFDRLTRIKILTKDGLQEANFTIPLYHNTTSQEKLTGLKAITYNLVDGKVTETKLKSESVFKENYDANIDFMKVTMPNVTVGSVVEITYSIVSDFLFNFQDWEFQRKIPVVWSEYRAAIPEYFTYEKYMQGFVALSVAEQESNPATITITSKEREGYIATQTSFSTQKIDYTENKYRWAAKDVPAFKPEPYITSHNNYISKINFELSFTKFPDSPIKTYMGTWDDINKQFSESSDFGGEVTGNGFLKKLVQEITIGMDSPEKKLTAIYEYVKNNFQWNGDSRRFPAAPLKKTLEEKKGNSADINLLICSILNKAEFEVYPVLLSTRDHGYVREAAPISSQFNYVIGAVKIKEKWVLLDATEKLLPIGTIPERCLNGNGFLVSTNGYQWIKLQPETKSKTTTLVNLSINADGELSGNLTIDRSGYHAAKNRKNYLSKGEQDYIKDFIGVKQLSLTDSKFENIKQITEPLKESHNFLISEATSSANIIYFNPLLFDRIEENPFGNEKREYPVDYGSPFDLMYSIKINVPEGYKVDELPQSKVFTLPQNAGRYLYNMVLNGNTINFTSIFQINRNIFSQLEYPQLREFYSQVVAKQAEQIVLKKL